MKIRIAIGVLLLLAVVVQAVSLVQSMRIHQRMLDDGNGRQATVDASPILESERGQLQWSTGSTSESHGAESIVSAETTGSYTCRGKIEILYAGEWREIVVPCLPDEWMRNRVYDTPAPATLSPQRLPEKPWAKGDAPKICAVQRGHATAEYIDFCITNATSFPLCDDMSRLLPWPGSQYFEVLDCSWHEGLNPRGKQ